MINNNTLPKVFVYLLNTIETLYQSQVTDSIKNRRNTAMMLQTDPVLITCYLWGVIHLCETTKAKHQLACGLFSDFPEYSRFVRRCNALLPFIQRMRQAFVFREVQGIDVSIIDSFPIPMCQPIRNLRSCVLPDFANIGYNATKSQHYYGCKCHTLVSESGYVLDYVISEASQSDSAMTELLLESTSTAIVLGDKGYIGQDLHDRLMLQGIQLITPIRKNMKRKMIAFPNFSKRRKIIERVFSFLTNLGIERSKSRSTHGFQLRVEMIILAYSLLLKQAKSVKPETLRYSIGFKALEKIN
jgi:hypothetical protein